ncbi:SDR family NAD(P)-dependent oxidoreductase [Glaciibacter superstes]|uniref:SDR family NAD(P)-dependent oxidoreductase n=1 Tax=Glaciibacter superstes TaxID=501023 RepID=UPI0003B62778|nr:SDR family oxidoreductase [Glaciibacter superstes]
MRAGFVGKTALITGAGRGIGAAIAGGLARAGADVILLARTADQLDETANAIRASSSRAEVRVVTADLTDDAQRAKVIADLLSGGPIDVLINNAATVEPLGASATISPNQLRQAFEINVIAPVALSAALAPRMAKAGWARIVNVSSSVVGHPSSMIGGNAYAATKAALEAHSLNLAAELDGTGVTVNVYRPGGVDTAMQGWIRSQDPQRIGAGLRDRFVTRYHSGALITPQESANALLGHLLGPDGGRTGAIWDFGDTVTA